MPNQVAHAGPYVDQSLTRRNVTGQSVPTTAPARTGSTPTPTTVYDVDGTNHAPGEQNEVPAAHKPFWPPGQDPYKNGGMPGQEFFNQ